MWYTSSHGTVQLRMTYKQAASAAHSGACDVGVRRLLHTPAIARQLADIEPAMLARALRDYGAWGDAELRDHNQNLRRIVWVAAGEIMDCENPKNYF